jgi:hypothetical protein
MRINLGLDSLCDLSCRVGCLIVAIVEEMVHFVWESRIAAITAERILKGGEVIGNEWTIMIVSRIL